MQKEPTFLTTLSLINFLTIIKGRYVLFNSLRFHLISSSFKTWMFNKLDVFFLIIYKPILNDSYL